MIMRITYDGLFFVMKLQHNCILMLDWKLSIQDFEAAYCFI
jgi:hypothetical protein